jgi:DNA mismatch repair ATPase MutS
LPQQLGKSIINPLKYTLMKTYKISDIRKEMKAQKGTFYLCVNYLFSFENCPQLKAILPASKNKAKTEEHEIACKKFVRFGETLERKVTKTINGEKQTTIITYIKNSFTADEVLRYFLNIKNGN